ncbi:MAG TPA: hypothetical protein VFB42_08780 [Gaiellaceae bacterium]|nr:hypothetical protein [Gaiellaceae bacterium]
MRRRLLIAVALPALLAACGGGPKSNGEAGRTAEQIVADAQAAVRTATSVHVTGSSAGGGTPLRVDLELVAGRGGKGRVTANGLTFDLVRIGSTAYVKGDASFWRSFVGAGAARLLEGRWLKASATTGDLATFTPLTDLERLFTTMLGAHGKLEKGDETTIGDAPAIEVRDAEQGGTLYVSTRGKPYPLALAKGGAGKLSFGAWDEPVELRAPPRAVDISTLGR